MHTVVIVAPHPLFRLGLHQLLNDALPQLSIKDYDYSSLNVQSGPSSDRCVLLLLSLNGADCGAKLATAAVKRFSPERILLLAETNHLPDSSKNLPECVAGAVPREAPPEILQASVSLVLAGGTCFPAHWHRSRVTATPFPAPSTTPIEPARYEPAKWDARPAQPSASRVAVSLAPRICPSEDTETEFSAPIKPGSAAHKESQLLGLTPRQYEVLLLLARGYPMKKVGRALNISVATAKAHTETLYQRLDVHNRNAAVYEAVSRGATLGWALATGGQSGQR